ncbi:unnamed protein product [Schistosoma curassoni]|uniref:Homeobox domain-containing protein n=1 Tax=Schistosoma curassoni TaxID=6186 RepID=A0A183L7N4_9TREM|nr:unnamed protein product [Schistosoma curassoni]
METCPTSRPSSNTNVSSNKSFILSKLPVVNPSNSTPVYKNPRLVNVDNRIRLLTPLNNRSVNIINSSINNNVKSIDNTLSPVQDASKTLTAILTNASSIVTPQTGYEPPLLMSHPISGHLVSVTSYSTLPVSSFQLMAHTVNNPINQGQIIQSSALTSQNSSLKILNTGKICFIFNCCFFLTTTSYVILFLDLIEMVLCWLLLVTLVFFGRGVVVITKIPIIHRYRFITI